MNLKLGVVGIISTREYLISTSALRLFALRGCEHYVFAEGALRASRQLKMFEICLLLVTCKQKTQIYTYYIFLVSYSESAYSITPCRP